MIDQTADFKDAARIGASTAEPSANRTGIRLISAPVGLVRPGRGLARSGHDRAPQALFDSDHLYKMSRHFVWLIPRLEHSACSWCWDCSGAASSWPGRAAVAGCSSAACARSRSCPPCWSPFPGSTPGLAARGAGGRRAARADDASAIARRSGDSSSPVSRRPSRSRRSWAASLWVGDRNKQCARHARPFPPPGSPNVLLIVMDTVAAGHLSLHGYGRATSTTLVRARRPRDPIRSRPGGFIMDAPVSCDDVHRPMAARAVGRLGSRPSTGLIPRWPSISGTAATRRPVSSPIRPIVAPIRDWPAASRATRISSSRS